MDILNPGDIVMLKDLVFENNNADLERNGHPGVVLIPTDKDDEYCYFIHMTSSNRMYLQNQEQFFRYKKSFINMQDIVKKRNYYCPIKETLDQSIYIALLKDLYSYQKEKNESELFGEIEEEIKIILFLNKYQQEHPSAEINTKNIKMLKIVNEGERKLLLDAKYNSIDSSENANQVLQLQRLKDKLLSYVINPNNSMDINALNGFYSNLKIFNSSNLEQNINYALLLLRYDENYEKYSEKMQKLYAGIKQIIDEEHKNEIEKEKRAELRATRKKEKRKNENNARKNKNYNKKRENYLKKYGGSDFYI